MQHGPTYAAPPEPIAYRVVGIAVLVLCWVQFTGAWLWPPLRVVEWGIIETQGDKPGGVLLQYPLWLLIAGGFGLAVFRQGMTVVRHLAPFALLLCLMLVASVFGITMTASTRITILWLLSVLAGAVAASLLDRDTLFRTLAWIILVTMLLSLLSFLLTPEYGADRYRARFVLRGLFLHKNTAGRVAALAFTLLFVMRHHLPPRLLLGAMAITGTCLVLTDSKTSWLSAMAAMGFLWFVELLRRRVTVALGTLVVIGGLAISSFALALIAPLLAEAIGRDLTFTGRTTIWSAYLNEIRHILWLGAGPGNMTTPSPLTAKLSLELRAHGSIFSPHSFYIGTLGDIGLPGFAYTMGLFVFLTLWRPLADHGPFSLGAAAVGASTLIGGLGETLDAAQPGSTWFLLSLFWVGHCLERDAQRAPASAPAPAATAPPEFAHGS